MLTTETDPQKIVMLRILIAEEEAKLAKLVAKAEK